LRTDCHQPCPGEGFFPFDGLQVAKVAVRGQLESLTDISQISSKFVEIVQRFSRQQNRIPQQSSDGMILEIKRKTIQNRRLQHHRSAA